MRLLVENSCTLFVNLVETPCQICLDVEEEFEWGTDLVLSPFKSKSAQAIFLLTLKMGEMGPHYSTDPNKFTVSI